MPQPGLDRQAPRLTHPVGIRDPSGVQAVPHDLHPSVRFPGFQGTAAQGTLLAVYGVTEAVDGWRHFVHAAVRPRARRLGVDLQGSDPESVDPCGGPAPAWRTSPR